LILRDLALFSASGARLVRGSNPFTVLIALFWVQPVRGSAVGTPTDSEDTLRFAELTKVRPMIETYPLEKAGEAYARMMSGKAQFRVVLTM